MSSPSHTPKAMKFDSFETAAAYLRALSPVPVTTSVLPVPLSDKLRLKFLHGANVDSDAIYTQMDVRTLAGVLLGHIVVEQDAANMIPQHWHAFVAQEAIDEFVAGHPLYHPHTGRWFRAYKVEEIIPIRPGVEITEFFGVRESILKLIAKHEADIVGGTTAADVVQATIDRIRNLIKRE